MRAGPDVFQQSQNRDPETERPTSAPFRTESFVALSDEQRQLVDILQAQQHGMTARQLEAKLPLLGGGVQPLLDGLLERQLVARLNTLVPSYVYRFGGADLNDG